MSRHHSYWHLLTSIAGVVLVAGSAVAQEGAGDSSKSSLPFEIDAKATLSSGYTTNVFSTDPNIKGDYIAVFAPEIGISKKEKNYELAVGASMEIGRYFNFTSENYVDGAVRAEGRVKLFDPVVLFAGGDYLWEHEPRTSTDSVGGVEPTIYTDATVFGGLTGRIDAFTYKAGINYRYLDFDDVARVGGGVINNDDRDRSELELGGRVGYLFRPEMQAFVQVIYDDRSYDSALDDNDFRRDSKGLQVAVGLVGEIDNVTGEVLLGGLFYDYDDARFDDVATFDVGAKLTWRPNTRTRVTGTLERDVEETTIFGASSNVSTTAGARVDHWIAPDLSVFAYAFLGQDDFQTNAAVVSRIDYTANAGLGLRYFLTRNVFVGAEYGFETRNSDVAGADYTDHEFMLSIGADLDPAWKGDPAMATSEAGGFYVGGQLSDGAVFTSVEGPRGAGGTLTAEFGDFGNAGGVFAGYRFRVSNFMLGLEGEADLGSVEWTHTGNRVFSMERKNSFGLSGLLGFFVRNDVMLYGRVGITSTEFEGNYSRGGNTGRVTDRETGTRFGVGAEFPIGGGLSGRMEYVYTSHGDLVLGAPLGGTDDDIFNNADVLARFGLIYNFGAAPETAAMPVDFSGFYIGGQVGHGVLATDNTGPRVDGRTPFILNATRAGDGFTGGAFVGYGQTFGDIYLGGEIDSEFSNVNWNIDRDPTGRVYDVSKRGSVGASLRAGYVLNDSVLLYLRGGLIASRFETDYSIANTFTSDSELLTGFRFGGGIEYAVSDSTRMRLDYTRSVYPDYSVAYPTGVDRFDPTENLFRVGLILGF